MSIQIQASKLGIETKAFVSKVFRPFPPLFDLTKKLSRLCGMRDQIFQILEEFSHHKKDVLFIQIGSNDGISNDPLREFIIGGKWQGVLIEPIPYLFEELCSNYQNIKGLNFENCAISPVESDLILYVIDPNQVHCLPPSFARQISSFDKEHVIKHFSKELRIEDYIIELHVPSLSIEQVMHKYCIEKLDILHIDVEGFEFKLLINTDLSRVNPRILNFETFHLCESDKKSLFQYLGNSGYEIFDFGWDSVAIKNDLQLQWCQTNSRCKVYQDG
jgi:FkbM family methyltransferase